MLNWLFPKKPETRSTGITTAKLVNLGNYSDSPQIVVTEDTSLQLVTVRSCVDLIAQTVVEFHMTPEHFIRESCC